MEFSFKPREPHEDPETGEVYISFALLTGYLEQGEHFKDTSQVGWVGCKIRVPLYEATAIEKAKKIMLDLVVQE
jgi:hypothetical protein